MCSTNPHGDLNVDQVIDPPEEEQLVVPIQRSPNVKLYHRSDSDDERNKEAKLFSAIGKGKLQKVQKILEAGVKTNIVNKNNKDNTPLHYAIEKDNKEIVEELLLQKWNTDINAKNNNGDTPLHIAISKGNTELVQLLLRKQAKTDIKDNESKTSLSLDIKLNNSDLNRQSIIKISNPVHETGNNIKHKQSTSFPYKRQIFDINDSSQFIEETLDKNNYEIWLTQEDIANVARVKYNWHGENGDVIFEIIGSVKHLEAKLNTYKKIIMESDKQSLTFIINLNDNHWVTLIITHRNQQFSAYYINSLGGEITADILNILNSEMPSIEINNIKSKQQVDEYNCGIFALANAKIINDLIQCGQINKMEQVLLGYYLTSGDLQKKRKEFADALRQKKRIRVDFEENEPEGSNRKKPRMSSPDHQDMEVDQDTSYRKITSFQRHEGDVVPRKRSRVSVLDRPNEYAASGLKNTLHGNIYQLKLLMLFLKRGLDKGYSFRLATEMDDAEKFDDLVFQYENEMNDGIIYRFLQAKHKQDESKTISLNDLLTEQKGEFSLQKYFNSFRKIKRNSEFKGRNNEIKDFVICTNIDIHKDLQDSFEQMGCEDNILDIDVQNDSKEPKRLTLKIDTFLYKERLVLILKNSSDLNKLARKLVECVLDGKSVDYDKSKNGQEVNILNMYQAALTKEVIDSNSKTLHVAFLNGVNLSPEANNFRDAFEEIFSDRRKSFNLDNNPIIKKEDLENFAKEIAALLKDQGKQIIKIDKRKKVIKNNFHILAGYVLIKKDTVQFSTAFLNGKQLPGNLNDFRTKLKEKLPSNVIFSNLAKYRFEVYKDFKTCEEIYVNRNAFWEGIKDKELKLFNNFGKIDTNLESAEQFAEKIANLLDESRLKGKQNVIIKRNDNIITNNVDKLVGHVLKGKDDKIQFSSEFLSNVQLPGNLDTFRSQLKDKLRELDFDLNELSKYEFYITDFPKSDLPNDSVSNIENDINRFLNKLVFVVNQPNEDKLGEIIKLEIGEEFNLLDSDFIYSQFLKEMLDWMKKKKGYFLSHEDGRNFFYAAKRKLYNLELIGLTLEYSSKVKELGLTFRDTQTELQSFLASSEKQFFNLISPQNTILGSIKVYQTLKNVLSYKKDDSYIFIRLSSLLRIQDRVIEAFAAETSNHLLVVECKSGEENIEKLCHLLSSIILSNNKKKVILITKENNALAERFKNDFSRDLKYDEIKDDKNSLIDLSYKSQTKLLEKGKVIFQGEEVSLGTLICDNTKSKIDAEVLSKFINNERIEIGKALQDLGDVKDYYILRTLNRQVKIRQGLKKETTKFLITHNSNVTESNLQQDLDIVLISDEGRDFEELCNKYTTYNIHWLKEENNEYTWQQSYATTLFKLRKFLYVPKRSIKHYEEEKGEVTGITDKVVIIAAEPGMGKSTILTNLAVKIKKSDPSLWILRINLVDHSSELMTRKGNKTEFGRADAIKFLYRTAGFKLFEEKKEETKVEKKIKKQVIEDVLSSITVKGDQINFENYEGKVKGLNLLEIELANDFYNRGKIAVLFDGFDEVSPYYKDIVTELLRVLKATKLERIWVTTRPYGILRKLEDELSIFSYSLEPFSRANQETFLKDFWARSLELKELDSKRSKSFIDELLHKHSQSTNDKDRKFLSIPLQIKMIATVFQDTFKEFYCSNEQNLSHKQKQNLSNKLNLVALYDDFFKIKFDEIYLQEKNPGLYADRYKVSTKRMIENEREKSIEEHKKLALCGLFGKDGLEKLLPGKLECVLEDKDSLFESIKQGKDKIGIIDRIVGNTPIFVHQTFAEYFAALWLADGKNRNKPWVVVFLREHIFKAEHKVTCNFFDYMLAKDKQGENKYEIHIAVLNNDKNEVENLRNKDGNVICSTDEGKRTALHLAADYGCEEIIEVLLQRTEEGPELKDIVNVKDELFDWSPLSYADKSEHWKIAELLLQNGANGEDMFAAISSINNGVVNERVETLLHIAAKEGYVEFAKVLVRKRAHINAIDKDGKTALHLAAQEGRLNVVKYFADDEQVDVEIADKDGQTPLHLAAHQGRLNVVKYFLEDEKIDIDIKDKMNIVPLHLAAAYGNLKTVQYLVRKGSNINMINEYGATPLHSAAHNGQLETVKYLMEEGADFIVADDSTPLHWAAINGKLCVVKYFIDEKNADFEAPEYDGSTLLHLAAMNGHLSVVKYLINEKNANLEAVDSNGRTPLHLAAKNGKLNIVEFFIDKKSSNLKFKDKDGNTALHLSAYGFCDIVRYIIDEIKADFNVKNKDGQTPLHIAASADNAFDVVKYLIEEKRADFKVQSNNGSTSLHLAAREGRLRVVNYLFDVVKDNSEALNELLFDTAKYGMTPLHYAALNGHTEVIDTLLNRMNQNQEYFKKLVFGQETRNVSEVNYCHNHSIVNILLERGAEAFIKNKHYTILHEAVRGNKKEVIKLILGKIKEKKDNMAPYINEPDNEGDTPLLWAAKENMAYAAELLLDYKADVNGKNNESRTVLHLAILNRHEDIVELFVRKGADVNAIDIDDRTPLHLAAQERVWSIVEFLMEKGAGVNVGDKDGRRILHWAAEDGNLNIVKVLIEKNANFKLKDKNGNTPLHLAAGGGELDTTKYLIEEKKADFKIQNNDGSTSLHLAARDGKLRMVNYILGLVKDNFKTLNELLFDTEKYGMTPLHYAALNDHTEVIDTLLSRMKYNQENFKKLVFGQESNVSEVNYCDNHSIVKLILERGAEAFIKNKQSTILHEAVRGNKKEVLKLILGKIKEKKENVEPYINVADNEGDTPLIWAAKENKCKAAVVLLEYKADVNIENKKGNTAFNCAIKENHVGITTILLKHNDLTKQ